MASNVSLDDPYLPLAFALYSNPGAYAVLAGAGVSRGAGLLRKYFENADDGTEQIRPSVAHRAVARLMQAGAIRVALTISFDRLFEQILQKYL